MKINRLFTQKNIKWIGNFIDVLYLTVPLFGMISYAMMTITMYTVIQTSILALFPWMKLWIFLLMLVVLCLVLLLIVYKFIYPSYFTFRNRQEYLHNNLLRRDLKAIMDKLGVKYEEN